MLAARISLPHFSVSSASSLPKSEAESTSSILLNWGAAPPAPDQQAQQVEHVGDATTETPVKQGCQRVLGRSAWHTSLQRARVRATGGRTPRMIIVRRPLVLCLALL